MKFKIMHPSVPFAKAPVMSGHRNIDKKEFRYDDIAARMNPILKAITHEELAALGLADNYETKFCRRKKHLLEANRHFEPRLQVKVLKNS